MNRGACTKCGKQIVIKQDGTLRPHGRPSARCPGSGARPDQPVMAWADVARSTPPALPITPRRDGLDWLLNSRHVHIEVAEHFWHLEDGTECDCEATGRV